MDDGTKTTMTLDDDYPLVPAIVVDSNLEPSREIVTEFVVIDDYFGNDSNSPDLLSESNNSTYSTSTVSTQNVDYADSNRNHSLPQENHQIHLQEDFTPNNVRHSKVDSSQTLGAWAAGIVLGFVVGVGPSLSMVFGIGAAYYSSQEESVVGDVARAIGDVALMSHAKFVQVNEKHKLVDTFANGVVAFSRNCLLFTRTHIGSPLSVSDKKDDTLTRQPNTKKKKTT